MDNIEKAAVLLGKYAKPKQGAAHSANVITLTGTATGDSVDGIVTVDLGGMTISDEDMQAVELPTTCDVREGDTVQVQVSGADGTAKNLLVTGVIGGGDRINAKATAAQVAADAAGAINLIRNSISCDFDFYGFRPTVLSDASGAILTDVSGTFLSA
ncbi:hypothetical protein ACRQ5I_11575 [Pseudoramibacter alactolyticus]|nr:hypothetical protein [Pseudoramibacter alactolyticus]